MKNTCLKLLVTILALTFSAAARAEPPPANTSGVKNFFDLSANDIDGKKINFSQYRGKVVLVVNTASHCGFTPQMKDLKDLQKKYADKGFTVLAFPSDDFHQEMAENDQIVKFAKKEYSTTFPFFEKGSVSGDKKQPVFQYLIAQKPGLVFKEISWNFEKFLINRQGQVVDHWNSMTKPSSSSVTEKIEKALTEPL